MVRHRIDIPVAVFTQAMEKTGIDYAKVSEKFGAMRAFNKPIDARMVDEALALAEQS